MNDQFQNIENPAVRWAVLKVASMWTLIGVSSWQEAASFIAFIYSACLLGEWAYKKYRAWRSPTPTTNNGETVL